MGAADHLNRMRHDRIRANPSRPRMLLREAITDLGIEVIGWEYEVPSPHGYAVWFDAAVRVWGKEAYIFLRDPHIAWNKQHHHFNHEARRRKELHCKEGGYPYVEVWPLSKAEIMAQIELWRMTMNKQPYRDAPKTAPRKAAKVNPKFKDKRSW